MERIDESSLFFRDNPLPLTAGLSTYSVVCKVCDLGFTRNSYTVYERRVYGKEKFSSLFIPRADVTDVM